jgi:hypothetical protein
LMTRVPIVAVVEELWSVAIECRSRSATLRRLKEVNLGFDVVGDGGHTKTSNVGVQPPPKAVGWNDGLDRTGGGSRNCKQVRRRWGQTLLACSRWSRLCLRAGTATRKCCVAEHRRTGGPQLWCQGAVALGDCRMRVEAEGETTARRLSRCAARGLEPVTPARERR